MKTTERFEKAVTKLYNAFNEGTLDSMDCHHCAVGNMCNNTKYWAGLGLGTEERVIENEHTLNTGYSKIELSHIEMLFLYGRKTKKEYIKYGKLFENDSYTIYCPKNKKTEAQFKGLCAVVEYLCELDNIPNVMDYQALFSNKKQLEEVF